MICAHCGEPDIAGPCPTCGTSGLLREKYALDAVLGRGAHGTMYRARQGDRTFAIKELPLRPGTPDKAVALFHREAEVLRQIAHPQIPAYSEHFEDGRGKHRALYIVQELVDGSDLQRGLDEHRFDEREVLALLADLLPVFVYLHGRSPPVVHRDVKPRNVVRRTDGRLFLVDFGTVRDALQDPDLGGSTVAGTFGYMAPEQFVGDASPASDLYGVGALAVFLLTRRAPHTMLDSANRLAWRAHTVVSDGTADLLDRLLVPDPAARAASAEQVLRQVQALLAAPPAALPVPTQRQLPAPTTAGSGRLYVVARVDAEVDPKEFDVLAGIIENALGASGQVTVVGRSLRWKGAAAGAASVAIEPYEGGTRIRAHEDLRGQAGGLFGGLGGGVGGGVGGGGASGAYMVGGPLLAVAWVAFWTGISILLATGLYARIRRTRLAALQRAVADLEQAIARR